MKPVYGGPRIGQSIRIISGAVANLAAYLERTGRPGRRLVYEDFADGGFSGADAVCESLGAPPIVPGRAPSFVALQRTTDGTNDACIDRFREGIDPQVQASIDRYESVMQPGPHSLSKAHSG